ncbi:MAG: DUF4867 family protein [Selenomonadaceae bacterium]|nr:DUF4867 family protein [Selenomonadaceae bacterium]
MKNIYSENFRQYGRVLDLDVADFVKKILERPKAPYGQVVYEPSIEEFEALPLFAKITVQIYGGMYLEFGHCSGFNNKLNALEYHRSSEINIAATDLILMLGRQQDIDYKNFSYDTNKIEIFFVPAGTAVELYATTLHYAPCSVNGKEFRCGVILPFGTNSDLLISINHEGENKLLFAVNKWLIAHEESGIDGAWIGLRGKNLTV